MKLQQNIGPVERVFRGVVGVWLLVMAPGAFIDGRRTTAAIAAIAGAGLLSNARTQHCGGYALCGIDRASKGPESTE